MKRLFPVLIAFSLGACAAGPEPASAQDVRPEAEQPPTLHVSASATVRRAPDVAVIQLAVETLGTTAREASHENTALMEQVLDAVRGEGVPGERIRTQRLELQPRYDNRRDETRGIVGYRAVNQVTVRLHDVAAAGPVVDAAVTAGANRVTGIAFELRDPESAYHDALRDAIAKARAEAGVAAAALGLTLGSPVQVTTGGHDAPGPRLRAETMMAMDQRGAPPVEPGEVEVRASVSIAWRLDP